MSDNRENTMMIGTTDVVYYILMEFKELEKRVPPAFKSMRNKMDQTPKDIFYSTHKDLMDSAKNDMRDKANLGLVVATIIQTIVFGASLTTPAQDVSPERSSSVLQMQRWFIVLFVCNSFALFFSSASTIFFLMVFMSNYAEDEFESSLLRRFTFAIASLFLGTIAMMAAFIAVSFLIFNHYSTWVAYLVASLGFGAMALFVFLLYTPFSNLFSSLYWSKHLLHQTKPRQFHPAHFYNKRLKLHEVALLSLVEWAIEIYDKLACKLTCRCLGEDGGLYGISK